MKTYFLHDGIIYSAAIASNYKSGRRIRSISYFVEISTHQFHHLPLQASRELLFANYQNTPGYFAIVAKTKLSIFSLHVIV